MVMEGTCFVGNFGFNLKNSSRVDKRRCERSHRSVVNVQKSMRVSSEENVRLRNSNGDDHAEHQYNYEGRQKPKTSLSFEEEGLRFLEEMRKSGSRSPRRSNVTREGASEPRERRYERNSGQRENTRFRAERKKETNDTVVVVGRIYSGVIESIASFGVFVVLENGKKGLVHISEVSSRFVSDLSAEVKVGQRVDVKVISHDERKGRLSMSIKLARGAAPKGMEDSKYNRIVMLGGDWGDPWNTDGNTKWADFGTRPKAGPDYLKDDPAFRTRRPTE